MFQKPERQFERELHRAMTPYPALETERLLLRRVFGEDLEDLHEGASDCCVTRYEPWGPNRREETRALLHTILTQMESGTCTEWAIERRVDAKVLGLIHLNQIDYFNRSAEIGYWLARAAWGQGFATEAVGALILFSIQHLRLDELCALCHPANKASMRVLEKCGMRYIKTLPAHLIIAGESVDCLSYHITRWDLL